MKKLYIHLFLMLSLCSYISFDFAKIKIKKAGATSYLKYDSKNGEIVEIKECYRYPSKAAPVCTNYVNGVKKGSSVDFDGYFALEKEYNEQERSKK